MHSAPKALTGPRAMLAVLAVLFSLTAAATVAYPPNYVTAPLAWAALAALAGTLCAATAIAPGRKRVTVAGAAAVTAAAVRSAAIGLELALSPPAAPQSWSFAIACLSWATIAVMVHSLWEHVVLPWAALLRDP